MGARTLNVGFVPVDLEAEQKGFIVQYFYETISIILFVSHVKLPTGIISTKFVTCYAVQQSICAVGWKCLSKVMYAVLCGSLSAIRFESDFIV